MSNSLDNYLDFCIVVESTIDPDAQKIKILDMVDKPNSSFLRYTSVLSTCNRRNRNQRNWPTNILQKMLLAPEIQEAIKNGGVPGENGHPIPDTGEASISRIVSIDPNRVCQYITNYTWKGPVLSGVIETADDGNGPGNKLMRAILQKKNPSVSLRSLVPQRKNADGTIDVTGVGRYVTHDRVFVPSDSTAWINIDIPVKGIVTKNELEYAMESYAGYLTEKSEKTKRILDGYDVAMETASIDKTGTFSVNTTDGKILLHPELKYRNEFSSYLRSL